MPSAKTDSCSSAPPENRLSRVKTPLVSALCDGVEALLHVAVRDARAGQRGAEPVDRDDADCEQQLLAQVRRPERTEKGGEQRSSSCARRPPVVRGGSGWVLGRVRPMIHGWERTLTASTRTVRQIAPGYMNRLPMLPRRSRRRRPWRPPVGRHWTRRLGRTPYSSVAEPPAAAIFSLADALNACAETWSATPPRSPAPRTLTGWPLRTAPASTSSTGPTCAAVREQLGEPVQVDDLEHDLELVLEALELRQAHVDGHLPTLERRRDVLAGLGALGTATGGLALGALTATHAGLRGLGTRAPGAGGEP